MLTEPKWSPKTAEAKYRTALINAGHLPVSTVLDDAIITLVEAKKEYEKAAITLKKRYAVQTHKLMLERSRLRVIAWEVKLQQSDRAAAHDIVETIAQQHLLEVGDLKTQSKVQYIVRARQEAFVALREHTSLSFEAIGAIFGRDHTTIIHGARMHKKRAAEKLRRKQAKDEQCDTR